RSSRRTAGAARPPRHRLGGPAFASGPPVVDHGRATGQAPRGGIPTEPRSRSGSRWVPARVQRHEVAVARHLDQVRRELRRAPEEPRGVDQLLDDVAGMAAPEAQVLLAIVREDLAHRLGLVIDPLAGADPLEDLIVLLDRRRLDADLVPDTAQERLVDQIC